MTFPDLEYLTNSYSTSADPEQMGVQASQERCPVRGVMTITGSCIRA